MQWDSPRDWGCSPPCRSGLASSPSWKRGRATTRWLWLIAAAATSSAACSSARSGSGGRPSKSCSADIDGLFLDEVLLLGLVPGIATEAGQPP